MRAAAPAGTIRRMDDQRFVGTVADGLAGLPGVEAVTLGGSRAQGTQRPDSDWDVALYYRHGFDPAALRALGWPGEVSEIGGWSPGVFNGGAWLEIDGRPVDVHYRDLAVVERELAESAAGRFRLEPLAFHLAGIPTYLVVAELGINQVLRGTLPKPDYPVELRRNAPGIWWAMADMVFAYARSTHAEQGRLAQCVGLVAQAASQSAHAVLAARGQWVTNEKTLLTAAGLRRVDQIVAGTTAEPGRLLAMVDEVRELCARTVEESTQD